MAALPRAPERRGAGPRYSGSGRPQGGAPSHLYPDTVRDELPEPGRCQVIGLAFVVCIGLAVWVGIIGKVSSNIHRGE